MTKPFWRKIDIVRVNATPPLGFWNLVVDWVSGPRLLKFTASSLDNAGATVGQTWQMAATEQPCDGNGMTAKDAASSFLCKGINPGALIGKIGGCVADIPEPPPKGEDSAPYPGRRAFPVGNLCVVQLATNDGGPLYLGMNDDPKYSSRHVGTLYVLIEEAAI